MDVKEEFCKKHNKLREDQNVVIDSKEYGLILAFYQDTEILFTFLDGSIHSVEMVVSPFEEKPDDLFFYAISSSVYDTNVDVIDIIDPNLIKWAEDAYNKDYMFKVLIW